MRKTSQKEEYKVLNELSNVTIDRLKAENGKNLTLIQIKNDTQKTIENFVFKKYSMMSMKNANSILNDENATEFDAAEVLFNDGLVYGRFDAVDDVDVFPQLVRELKALRDEVEVNVKKL